MGFSGKCPECLRRWMAGNSFYPLCSPLQRNQPAGFSSLNDNFLHISTFLSSKRCHWSSDVYPCVHLLTRGASADTGTIPAALATGIGSGHHEWLTPRQTDSA